MKNKGFTLIELLVVIAIIGILNSLVLAALNEAAHKSKQSHSDCEKYANSRVQNTSAECLKYFAEKKEHESTN